MIREIAMIPVLPAKAAEFEAIFIKRRARVLAEEPGTLLYDLLRSDQGQALYDVHEYFASEVDKTFNLANSTDHEPMMACFDGTPTVHRLEPIIVEAPPRRSASHGAERGR